MTDADTAKEEAEHEEMISRCRYNLSRDILLRFLGKGIVGVYGAGADGKPSIMTCIRGASPADDEHHLSIEGLEKAAVQMADALLHALGLLPKKE